MAAKNKYSAGLSNFICDKVSEGITVAQICRDYKDQLPAEKTIYEWRKKYPEFKDALTLAYQTLIYKQMDELNDLSKQLIAEEKDQGHLDIDEAKRMSVLNRDRRDNIRVRIDAIKFSLSHLAPKLVPELKDQPKAQFNIPAIQIINYSDAKEEKEIKKLT